MYVLVRFKKPIIIVWCTMVVQNKLLIKDIVYLKVFAWHFRNCHIVEEVSDVAGTVPAANLTAFPDVSTQF